MDVHLYRIYRISSGNWTRRVVIVPNVVRVSPEILVPPKYFHEDFPMLLLEAKESAEAIRDEWIKAEGIPFRVPIIVTEIQHTEEF